MITDIGEYYTATGEDVSGVACAHYARMEAEAHSDPERYDEAALLFDGLGMMLAAARCRERAEYYRTCVT